MEDRRLSVWTEAVRAEISCNLLYALLLAIEFNLYSQLLKQSLEDLVKRLVRLSPVSQLEQEAQVYLIMSRVKAMLR